LRRRQRQRQLLILVLSVFLLIILVLFFNLIFSFGKGTPEDTVIEFYELEKKGEFSRSWELLHPLMQEKFQRGPYVQDRAHVFIGHFGAETFSFEVGEEEKLKDWRMEKDGKAFETVYEFEVEQTYRGKYGHFKFVQFVYVVREEDEWRIVWDYGGS